MLTLVLLAAGLGTRFGGLKQLVPVGPSGEALMDYGVYDAARAGFGRVVLIVRGEIADEIGRHARRYRPAIDVELSLQDADTAAPVRPKPWGTCHAVLAAAGTLDTPFAVLNADDLYGPATPRLLAEALSVPGEEHCLVAYRLRTTLSQHGRVTRGVCRATARGVLESVDETSVPTDPSEVGLTGDELVSMNAWGFRPSILGPMRKRFDAFVDAKREDAEAELQLPEVVDELLHGGSPPGFRVLEGRDRWVGITHLEDLEIARRELAALVERDVYPPALWPG